MSMIVRIEFWDGEVLKNFYTASLTDTLRVQSEAGIPLVLDPLDMRGEDHYLMGFEYKPFLVKAKVEVAGIE